MNQRGGQALSQHDYLVSIPGTARHIIDGGRIELSLIHICLAIIIVLTLHYYAYTYLLVSAALNSINSELEAVSYTHLDVYKRQY